METKRWDVVVVGSGPGGSVAAKKCAESGLETLLIEKKKLPRDKVCSGMILGQWATDLVQQEFGDIPTNVLVEPYNGVTFHIGREESITVQTAISVGWRKNLDYWMCRGAIEKGVQIKDGTRLSGISEVQGGYELEVVGENKETGRIYTRFIVGADGANSTVRKLKWPDLKVRYRPVLRECYQVKLSIEKEQFHWFFPLVSASPRFDVNYKEGHFLLEGNLKAVRGTIAEILKDYGFPPEAKPTWVDGCVNPDLHDELLFTGSFVPAKDNIFLVGDAGAMLFPFTHEGIGSALKSGILAGESIVEALARSGRAAPSYLRKFEGVKSFLKELEVLRRGMADKAKKGPRALLEAMAELIKRTL
jgi:flavin-dependent dehydrogenase